MNDAGLLRRVGMCSVLLALIIAGYVWLSAQPGSLISCVVFSPDGKYLAAARHDARDANTPGKHYLADVSRTISLIDTDGWNVAGVVESELKWGNQGPAFGMMNYAGQTLDFVDRSKLLAVIPLSNWGSSSIRLHDVSTRRLLSSVKCTEQTVSLKAIGDGRAVAFGHAIGFDIREIPSGTLMATQTFQSLPFVHGPVLTTSADGEYLAAIAMDAEYTGPEVSLWSVRNNSRIVVIKLNSGESTFFNSLAFHPNKPLLAVSTGTCLRFYDFQGKVVTEMLPADRPAHFILSIAFSPAGDHIAVGQGLGRDSLILDVKDGTEVGRLPGSTAVGRVSYSPDGKYLATGSWGGRAIDIWDAHTLKHMRSIQLPGRNPILMLLILPTVLAAGGIGLIVRSNCRGGGSLKREAPGSVVTEQEPPDPPVS